MSDSTSTPSPISGSRLDEGEKLDLSTDLDLEFDGAEDILRSWRKGMRPDPDLTVSEWADEHRWLSSRGAAEPGRYRTSRAPYLREIMDALSPRHPAQRVTFMKAAQVGATEAGNNWIGFVIHHAPGPMLAVLPSLELAKRTSRGRLDPLIADSPALRERVNPARSRDAGNSMLSKEFPGGILVLTGANSATGLRSMPARYIFLDEVDAYPASADEEGDPVTLAEARTTTFSHRRKVFMVSTPTIRGLSRIEREFDASDQRRYFVPCPHCGHMQWLQFERLRWDKGRPETAAYHCEGCERPIAEHHKTQMLEKGEWRATAVSADPHSIGFHISALYSPLGWKSWQQIAREWLAAQGSEEMLRVARNTLLGETWVESGDAPEWQRLAERRESYAGAQIPVGGLFLTLTASGTVTVSAAAATIGTATTTATYGMGTGATTTGVTKTVNLGTGGASGSTTIVNIGSGTAGSGGTTVVNTPIVTFANAVTQVGMPLANLTAQLLGLGGATADSYNRLSMNTPAVLINNAGAGIEATVNKAAAGNDAAFAFKTGFSARALIGLLGNDDFSFKVSPNGSTFFDAIRIDRASGRVELPEPVVMPALAAAPDPPPAGKLAVYARDRAGAGWLDVQRPSGRFFPLQPHFGVNRIATWAPSTSTTVNTNGMPRTAVGTVATPTLTTTGLADSMRRWRVTSAATASAVAEERSAGWVCWRGNAAGLGGWSYVNRLSLTTLQATGMGFFGLYGSTAALATTLTLAAAINAVGIGFQRGTHTNWQLVHNDGAGAPTLIDLGASFPVASMTNVLTLYIAAAPNGADIGVRVVEEVSGAAVEFTIATDMPAATQLLSPRNYMNNGATAAVVAYDCAGVYVETDY